MAIINKFLTGVLLLCSSTLFSVANANVAETKVLSTEQAQQAESVVQHSLTAAAQQQEKVSLNRASAEEFAAALSGIGLKKAQRIVTYREQYGPFTHIEQLQEVPGIGLATLEKNLARLML